VLEKGDVDFVLRELSQLPQKIQTAYVQQGNYWLTWFPTRGVRLPCTARESLMESSSQPCLS
jgi:predicted phosphoadenosine phosphosulfate sulfurtransferase